jgi:hypothetical protein
VEFERVLRELHGHSVLAQRLGASINLHAVLRDLRAGRSHWCWAQVKVVLHVGAQDDTRNPERDSWRTGLANPMIDRGPSDWPRGRSGEGQPLERHRLP